MTFQFGLARGAPRIVSCSVQIEHSGRRWTGTWRMLARSIWVDGPHGSTIAPVGTQAPEAVAALVLEHQIEAWKKKVDSWRAPTGGPGGHAPLH